MKKIFAIVVSVFYLSISTYGQVGAIDASFGTSGAYTFPVVSGINNVEANTMIVLSDDKIIVPTDEEFGSFLRRGKLNKLTSEGSLDASFGTGGSIMVEDSTFGYSNAILMPNGKLLASWHKNTPNVTLADDYPFLTMHHSDGSLVTSFGTNGRLNLPASLTGGTIGSIIVADANNNIYVMYDYADGEVIRSYTSTGAINTSFGNGGVLAFPNDGYTQMVYTPTLGGRLLLARYDANDNLAVSRYLLSGQLDFTYGSAGYVTIPTLISNSEGMELYTMGLQNDEKLLVHIVEYNSDQALSRVARINANGSLDVAFNNNAQIELASLSESEIFLASKLVQQTDGKIVLGGANIDFNTENPQKAFFRLNNDGTFDNSFGTNGLLALGTFNGEAIYDVKLQSTGKIIGLANDGSNNTAPFLIRLINDTNIGILETPNAIKLDLYPNPVRTSFELSYELKDPQTVSIYLIDAQGRTVHRFQENQKEHGMQTHTFALPTTIASGTYIVSTHTTNSVNNLQIIIK